MVYAMYVLVFVSFVYFTFFLVFAIFVLCFHFIGKNVRISPGPIGEDRYLVAVDVD
jgi:hypothetical protein